MTCKMLREHLAALKHSLYGTSKARDPGLGCAIALV